MDLSFLKQVIPTIATAFGGPLAGVAAGFVAEKLNLSDKTIDNVTNLIAGAPPEQLIELKKIDAELKKFFAELGIRELQLENADRDSARNREIQVKDGVNTVLAYTVVGGFMAVVGATLLGYAKIESVLAGTLIGYLSAKAEQVLAYYFGSTKGSADKTKLLVRSQNPLKD